MNSLMLSYEDKFHTIIAWKCVNGKHENIKYTFTNPSLLYRVWSLRSGQTGMIDPTRDPDGIAFGIIEII